MKPMQHPSSILLIVLPQMPRVSLDGFAQIPLGTRTASRRNGGASASGPRFPIAERQKAKAGT